MRFQSCEIEESLMGSKFERKKESFEPKVLKQKQLCVAVAVGRRGFVIGCFSSKTRTSLKTQLLFHVLEHSNFPAFSLPESYSQTSKFPKNSLHSRISIICECAHIAFCFPSRRPILSVRPSKVHFSGCQFQNRTYGKSLETCKSFEVDFSL